LCVGRLGGRSPSRLPTHGMHFPFGVYLAGRDRPVRSGLPNRSTRTLTGRPITDQQMRLFYEPSRPLENTPAAGCRQSRLQHRHRLPDVGRPRPPSQKKPPRSGAGPIRWKQSGRLRSCRFSRPRPAYAPLRSSRSAPPSSGDRCRRAPHSGTPYPVLAWPARAPEQDGHVPANSSGPVSWPVGFHPYGRCPEVSIAGAALDHLLYHFRLPNSGSSMAM